MASTNKIGTPVGFPGTPVGLPSTPSVLQAINTCNSNNNGIRPANTPGNTTTADWCAIYNFCNMQDPNAKMISSPGRATTALPPGDITGQKTYSQIYSPAAYCETSCQGINDAYFSDFKKTCTPGTSAIRDNNSKHNNPNAVAPGKYNPLYFKDSQCVQTQFICAPTILKPNTDNTYPLPKNTTLLKANPTPGASLAEINCDRIPGYFFHDNVCKINSGQTPPPNAANPASPKSDAIGAKGCPETPVSSSVGPGNSVADIGAALGMNQTCTTNESDAQAGFEEEANVSGYGVSGEEHASAFANAHHMATSGCANRNAQVSNFNSNKNSVACTLVDTNNSASISTSDSQSIKFKTEPPPDSEVALLNNLVTLCTNLESKGGIPISFCSDDNLKTLTALLNRDINIDNSTIINNLEQSAKVQAKTNSDNIQNTAATFTDSVKQAITSSLQNMIGSNALPQNSNQLIDQAMTDNQNIINDAITNINQTAQLVANGNQATSFDSNGALNISGSNIGNKMITNLTADSTVKTATRIGQQIAGSIAAQMDNTTSTTNKIAGEDAMINALGAANAEGIAAHVPANNALWWAIVIIVVVCVIGAAVTAYIKMSGSKKSSVPGSGDSSVPGSGAVKSGSGAVKSGSGDSVKSGSGDSVKSGSGDSSVKSSSFRYMMSNNKKSKMLDIENGEVDYKFICNISLAFCIFILIMFLICKKK
jgi:hypothetical protein